MELPEDLTTGIEVVDEQHRNFLHVLENLEERIENEGSCKDVDAIISYIETFANAHFDAEETYMELIGYDHIEDHRDDHKKFRQYLDELIEKLSRYGDYALKGVVVFLKEWLAVHIEKQDKYFIEYLRENNIDTKELEAIYK